MAPRVSHDTGRVRVIFIGELITSFRYLVEDPFFDVTPIPALSQGKFALPYDVIHKAMRRYMPRRYEDLTGEYDVISLNYADYSYFEKYHSNWFTDAVRNEGLGLFITGGGLSFRDWYLGVIQEVLPVDPKLDAQAHQLFYSQLIPARLRILEPEHPLMASLPWSGIGQHGVFYTSTPVTQRAGSEVLADLVPTGLYGYVNPCFIWWDVGKGRSFTMTGTLNPPHSAEFTLWDFFYDWSSNLHLFMADQDIPSDVYLVHSVRDALDDCWNLRGVYVSLSDFVSKLGGSTVRLDQTLAEMDKDLAQIASTYLAHDFEGSLALTDRLKERLEEAMDLATEAKNQTLLWIYLIEWTIVTSTSLVVGILLWTLMVRRSLYAQVETTRLTRMLA